MTKQQRFLTICFPGVCPEAEKNDEKIRNKSASGYFLRFQGCQSTQRFLTISRFTIRNTGEKGLHYGRGGGNTGI
jgi:hypothetical protein